MSDHTGHRPMWRRSAEVAHVTSPERAALLDLRRLDQPPYILQGSGAVIWALLEEATDEDALVSRVATYFETETDEVAGPVLDFVQDLANRGLVERFDPADS